MFQFIQKHKKDEGNPSLVKLELAKYYKDSDMTAYISERSRNSKGLKKYDPP